MSTAVVKHDGVGITTRDGFSGRETERSPETAMAAVAAREQAMVQAQYLMAERHPRNWMDVRRRMLDHLKRSTFADKAWYKRPAGRELNKQTNEWEDKFAEGFSIRFAETLAQEMRNIKPWSEPTYEDDRIRIVRIGVTDLEANLPWERSVTIAKVVEKKGKKKKGTANEFDPPDGREVISARPNSYGDLVFLCYATDDEIAQKEAILASKIHRNFILKLTPKDILEDCEDERKNTIKAEFKQDPTKAKKKLLDRFFEFGIMPSELVTYIGRPDSQWTEENFEELKALGTAMKEGEITFPEALQQKWNTETESGEQTGSREKQEEVAKRKIEELQKQKPKPVETKPAETTAETEEERDRRETAEALAREAKSQREPSDADESVSTKEDPPTRKPQFGAKPQGGSR